MVNKHSTSKVIDRRMPKGGAVNGFRSALEEAEEWYQIQEEIRQEQGERRMRLLDELRLS